MASKDSLGGVRVRTSRLPLRTGSRMCIFLLFSWYAFHSHARLALVGRRAPPKCGDAHLGPPAAPGWLRSLRLSCCGGARMAEEEAEQQRDGEGENDGEGEGGGLGGGGGDAEVAEEERVGCGDAVAEDLGREGGAEEG